MHRKVNISNLADDAICVFILLLVFHKSSIFFSECVSGTYGINCESSGDTCVNNMCDRHDRQCTYGCYDHYEGDFRQLPGILTLY